MLQRGGVAVGLIWSTPLVKSARVFQSGGSPPPSSTTTTTRQPIRLTFTGLFTVRNQTIDLADPACAFARWRIDAAADLTGQPSGIAVNPAQFQLDFCVDIGAFTDGTMSFGLPGGDLTGDLTFGSYFSGRHRRAIFAPRAKPDIRHHWRHRCVHARRRIRAHGGRVATLHRTHQRERHRDSRHPESVNTRDQRVGAAVDVARAWVRRVTTTRRFF
jgi:hypothetical protein